MDSGIHSSLHSKYHDQIVYWKSYLKNEYPPLFTCKLWDYNTADADLINHATERLSNKSVKQTINPQRIILIGYIDGLLAYSSAYHDVTLATEDWLYFLDWGAKLTWKCLLVFRRKNLGDKTRFCCHFLWQ